MIEINRRKVAVPVLAAIGHVVIVQSVLSIFGYPLGINAVTMGPFGLFQQILGLLVLAGVPVALLVYGRLVVPITLVILGSLGSIATEVAASPDVVQLGNHTFVGGTSYLGMYTTGWHVWLLAAFIGGVCECVVRLRWFREPAIPRSGTIMLPLSWRTAVLVGCGFGVGHVAVFVALLAEREGVVLMETVSVWGVVGGIVLGGIPVVLAVRTALVGPPIVLGLVVITTGIEALSTAVGTPVSSYFAYWPVYLGFVLFVAVVEALCRRISRAVAAYRTREIPNGL